jgi:membrane protein implicated in regulation of membrane protease activity
MDRNGTDQTVTGIAAVLTAGGAISMALFPFLLPVLLLTLVFALPLALLALPAIPVVLAVLAVRALAGRARRSKELRAADESDERALPRREGDVPQPDALRARFGRA